MSEEKKKTNIDNKDTSEKSDVAKKTVSAKKKVNSDSNAKSDASNNKKEVIEKLQAMGVMDGGSNHAKEKNVSKIKRTPVLLISSAVVIVVIGTFVWMLNDKAVTENITANTGDVQQVGLRSTPQQNYSSLSPEFQYQNNSRYSGYHYPPQGNVDGNQQQRMKDYQEQQQKWMQQQQQAYEQYRLQQQKWMQQQQQLREQQRSQQQKWMQQQQAQQPYYAYPSNDQYQGQSMSPGYNYAPAYQQSGQYYGPQY